MSSANPSTSLPWQTWLAQTPAQVFKADRRSKVWAVADDAQPAGLVVLKRFEYAPPRQALGYLTGIHPASFERRQTGKMIATGLPVVPILGQYACWTPLGCRVILASPWLGQSLQAVIRQSIASHTPWPDTLAPALAELVASLIEQGWVFRDLKTANIVVDAQGKPRLIDTGSARRITPIRSGQAGGRTWRMLRMLDHTMTLDGWPQPVRLAVLARPLACVCPDPIAQAYDKLGQIVLK